MDLENYEETTDRWHAKSLLEKGWVHLGLKVKRSVDTKGSFEDEITYLLGKPKKKE